MASLAKHTQVKGAWIIRYRLHGQKRSQKYLPTMTKADAEIELLDWIKKEKQSKQGITPKSDAKADEPKSVTRTFKEFVYGYYDPELKSAKNPEGWDEGYLAWRRSDWPKGYEVVHIHITTAVDYFGHLPIADDKATKKRWRIAWNEWHKDRKPVLKLNSLKGEWKDIKTALYRAAETGGASEGKRWDLCETNPVAGLVIATPKGQVNKKKKMFTPEELDGICAVDPENADMWRFGAWTGLRRGELMNLKWTDIDMGNNRAKLVVINDEDRQTKTGASRSVPLNSITCEIRDRLWAKAGDSEYVFPRWHKRTYTSKFDKAREAAGLEFGTLHGLRHTFISRMVNNGVAVHLVQKWAGHAKLETTLGYLDTPEGYEFIAIESVIKTENDNVVELDNMRKAA